MTDRYRFCAIFEQPMMGNELIRALDLGEGLFRPMAERYTITYREPPTPEQPARTQDAIRAALEKNGCVEIIIWLEDSPR